MGLNWVLTGWFWEEQNRLIEQLNLKLSVIWREIRQEYKTND